MTHKTVYIQLAIDFDSDSPVNVDRICQAVEERVMLHEHPCESGLDLDLNGLTVTDVWNSEKGEFEDDV